MSSEGGNEQYKCQGAGQEAGRTMGSVLSLTVKREVFSFLWAASAWPVHWSCVCTL